MNTKTLKELAEMQKRFKAIYDESGLCGISNNSVHITEEEFFDNFEPENCSERTSDTYYEYSATLDGVKFMCLSARDIKVGTDK